MVTIIVFDLKMKMVQLGMDDIIGVNNENSANGLCLVTKNIEDIEHVEGSPQCSVCRTCLSPILSLMVL